MKKIWGIGFYWGATGPGVSLTVINTYEIAMYGISIGETFVGIMVRGKRILPKRDDSHWEIDRLRAEGAYDAGRDGWQ